MTFYLLCLVLSDIGKMCVELVLSYIYQQPLLHSTKHLLYTLLCMNYSMYAILYCHLISIMLAEKRKVCLHHTKGNRGQREGRRSA